MQGADLSLIDRSTYIAKVYAKAQTYNIGPNARYLTYLSCNSHQYVVASAIRTFQRKSDALYVEREVGRVVYVCLGFEEEENKK